MLNRPVRNRRTNALLQLGAGWWLLLLLLLVFWTVAVTMTHAHRTAEIVSCSG